jgi:F-type H+-transporting ATPase subunit gamma
MGAQLRVFRRRIKSVQATKKITKAMELIASSRIVKAQQRLDASTPYLIQLTQAVSAAASHASDIGNHPLVRAPEVRDRAAVLVVTADRGLAGAYSANAIREAAGLTRLLNEQGLDVTPFVVGRKGVAWYRFRGIAMGGQYTGFTDQPTYADARAIGDDLLQAFLTPESEGGIDEIHVVYTHFVNMAVQQVRVRRILPLEIVDEVVEAKSGESLCRHRPRRPSPSLHRSRGLHRAAHVGRLRACRSPARHEVRDRQRRGPHSLPHPTGQRGSPGRDHPGDQRDRRRRRRTRLRLDPASRP